MNSVYKAVVCLVCLAVLVTAPIAAAQNEIEGVWKLTEVTITGPNASTNTKPEPSFIIFTKKYLCQVGLQGPQPELPQTNATDAQKLATWTPLSAAVGTYEINQITFQSEGMPLRLSL